MHSKCDKMSLELIWNWLPAGHVLTTVVLEADDEVSHVVSLLLVGVLFLCLCDPEGLVRIKATDSEHAYGQALEYMMTDDEFEAALTEARDYISSIAGDLVNTACERDLEYAAS